MDDPELLRYPIAYLSEPGYWLPDSSEAAGLRTWLNKGGFLIVDDFFGRQWDNFERSMHRVLPSARIVPLDLSHPIFDAFFPSPHSRGCTRAPGVKRRGTSGSTRTTIPSGGCR
jgi:hypothetical protein